jgi:hypothetical protein
VSSHGSLPAVRVWTSQVERATCCTAGGDGQPRNRLVHNTLAASDLGAGPHRERPVSLRPLWLPQTRLPTRAHPGSPRFTQPAPDVAVRRGEPVDSVPSADRSSSRVRPQSGACSRAAGRDPRGQRGARHHSQAEGQRAVGRKPARVRGLEGLWVEGGRHRLPVPSTAGARLARRPAPHQAGRPVSLSAVVAGR